MNKIKFYKCPICGKIMESSDGSVPVCCNSQALELIPGEVDASLEKHVPEYLVSGSNIEVQVGSAIHPMDDEHYIMWIALVNGDNITKKELKPHEEPKATFSYIPGSIIYAYCNLHGLWQKEVK